jgi:hypothetical protein
VAVAVLVLQQGLALLAVRVVQVTVLVALVELVRLVRVVPVAQVQLTQVVVEVEQALLERRQLPTMAVLAVLEQAHLLLEQQLLTPVVVVAEAMAGPVRQAAQAAAVRVAVAITVMLALQAL